MKRDKVFENEAKTWGVSQALTGHDSRKAIKSIFAETKTNAELYSEFWRALEALAVLARGSQKTGVWFDAESKLSEVVGEFCARLQTLVINQIKSRPSTLVAHKIRKNPPPDILNIRTKYIC